jgi:hypothetical protein
MSIRNKRGCSLAAAALRAAEVSSRSSAANFLSERKLANPVISNPTDHYDNGRGRHNLGFVLKTPQDFGRLC